MTTPRRVRRGKQCGRLLIAATVATFLVGCGESRESTGASPSTPNATTASPVSASVDPMQSADEATKQPIQAGMPANTGTAVPTPPTLKPSGPVRQSDSSRRDALSSFELVGTGIDGTNAFAIVRTREDGVVTVHEGGLIGGYTVRTIQADRIRLKARDDKEAMLVIGVSGNNDAPSAARADTMPSQASAGSAFVAAGINTDQSIPAHVVYGPTASWPAGEKHVH